MANNENKALLHEVAEEFGKSLNDILLLVHNLIRGGASHEQVQAILAPAKEAVAQAQAVAVATVPNAPASSVEASAPVTAGVQSGEDPKDVSSAEAGNAEEGEETNPNDTK